MFLQKKLSGGERNKNERVRVYKLNGNSWDEKGTGYVSCEAYDVRVFLPPPFFFSFLVEALFSSTLPLITVGWLLH